MKTRILAILIFLALAAGAGYTVYSRAAPSAALPASQAPTAIVRQGSLQVRVSGSGELVALEIPLAFAIPGVMTTLNAAIGDSVEAGQILARLDDRQAQLDLKAAQLNWEMLTSPQKVSEAEQNLVLSQLAVSEAQELLDFVQAGAPVAYYQDLYDQALAETLRLEADLSAAVARNDPREINRLKTQLDRARTVLEEARVDLDWAVNYQPHPHDLALAEAQVTLAAARLAAQQTLVDVLHGAPLPAADAAIHRNDALLTLERAWLAVEKAAWALDRTVLAAPAAGSIAQISSAPGERVDGSPVFVLRILQPFQVRFYLEETDLAQVNPGDRLEIRLQAYPDQVFAGEVVQIDPALVPVQGSLLAQVWGTLTLPPGVMLYPGMSLEVDVIAAEVSEALLIPLQALRQEANGTYFVDVQQADGSTKPMPVTIGIQDLANIQILSGVQAGDQVSTAAR